MEKKFIELKKERLAYIEVGAGETILLIHGNQSSGLHFSPIISELSEHYHVIAPDLRGFGDSSYNHRFDNLRDLSVDLKEFCDLMNLKKVKVIGWSTGAGVALYMAIDYPNLVESVISIEGVGYQGYPIFEKDENNLPVLGKAYSNKDALALDKVQALPLVIAFDKQDQEMIKMIWDMAIYNVNKPSKDDELIYLSETMKQRSIVDTLWALANFNISHEFNHYTQGSGEISKIKVPCLFTHAKFDLVVPEYMPIETAKALKEYAKVVRFENSGHSPFVDVKDELLKEIFKFYQN